MYRNGNGNNIHTLGSTSSNSTSSHHRQSQSTQLSPRILRLELNSPESRYTRIPEITANDHDSVVHDKVDEEEGEVEGRSMINPLRTYLARHPERGNGVFASREIRAGTVIEDSPVLIITRQQWADGKMDDCILGSYAFCWRQGGLGIGLGSASLFNHSSTPNVNFLRNYDQSTIRFTAARTIPAGHELCISYAADESKLWFVNSDLRPDQSGFISQEEVDPFPPVDLFGEEEDSDVEARRRARQRRMESLKGGHKQPGRRERKKAEYQAKLNSVNSAETTTTSNGQSSSSHGQNATSASNDIVSPAPVRVSQNGIRQNESQASSSSTSPSRTSTPNYPSLPDRSVSSPSLPPPLHSSKGKSRHEHNGPVTITPDLDWREEDYIHSRSSSREGSEGTEEGEWSGIERIKGFTELEEDQQYKDDQGLVDVWVVDVRDPKINREVLSFIKDHLPVEPELRHLKRVCRRRTPEGQPEEVSRVALCTTAEIDRPTLLDRLHSFSPLLSSLDPYISGVPKSPARDQAEYIAKHAIWPVSLAPPIRKQDASPRFWSIARRAWVEAGIKRVISIALEAKRQGELPVAVYCTSPPTALWPRMEDEGFIPPTPGLRASSHDTRISESHPLRHANLNCIASIARLRTVPPFSEMTPTRNGADYLLTSLSLFTLYEPCTMCTMALLHSRVREVFYVFPSGKSGGFQGEFGLHSRKDLNHRFEVWKWKHVDLSDDDRELLKIDPGVEI